MTVTNKAKKNERSAHYGSNQILLENNDAMLSILPFIFNSLPDAIIVTDLDGKIIFANDAIEELSGYSMLDLSGKRPGILNGEENSEEIQEKISNTIEKDGKWKDILKQKRKDGTLYWVEFEIFPVKDSNGNTIAWASIHRNVTERIEADQKLKESEDRYRKLAELSPDAIVVHNEGIVRYINRAGAKIVGSDDPESIIGKAVMGFVHPKSLQKVTERVKQAQEDGKAVPENEEIFISLEGGELVGEVKAVPISFEGKNSVLVVARDISERKRIEKEIREQKEELQEQLVFAQALNNLSEIAIYNENKQTILDSFTHIIGETIGIDHCIIYSIDLLKQKLNVQCQNTRNGRFQVLIPNESNALDINKDAINFFLNDKKMFESHYDNNNLIDRSVIMSNLIHDRLKIQSFYWYPFAFTVNGYYALLLGQLRTRRFKKSELDFILSAIKHVEIAIQKIEYLEDRKHALQALKENETKLRESEKEKELIFSAISEVVIFHDKNMKVKWANMAAIEYKGIGRDAMLGNDCYKVLYDKTEPCPGCPVQKAIITGESHKGEVHHPNGKVSHVKGFPVFDADDNIIGAVQISKDITETKEIEKEMARLERLNLVGEMAAGFGHEIRNPMSTVRGFLQYLYSKEEGIPFRRYYDLMIEELDRANAIISEFLSLARHKVIDRKQDNLNHIIEAIYPLILADAIHDDKSVELQLEDIPQLELDRKETNQLILNLVRNGLEAMSSGGCLTIKTYSQEDEVILAIQDQGSGISPDMMSKLGIPFVTTKENGTGLGLAICYSIVARHNAKMEVITGSEGTTFNIKYKMKTE